MRKNIYLHIGTPKTGTTSIQSFLINNNEVFNQYGYDYVELHMRTPKVQRVVDQFHINDQYQSMLLNGDIFRILFNEGFSLDEIFSLYVKEANKDCDNIIISAETIYQLCDMKQFIDAINHYETDKYNITIIINFRHIVEYLSSLFCNTRVVSELKYHNNFLPSEQVVLSKKDAEKARITGFLQIEEKDNIKIKVGSYDKSIDSIDQFLKFIDFHHEIADLKANIPVLNDSADYRFLALLNFSNLIKLRHNVNFECHTTQTDPILFSFKIYLKMLRKLALWRSLIRILLKN